MVQLPLGWNPPADDGWWVSPININEARAMIEAGHYLGHLRKSGTLLGLLKGPELMGVAVFGQPSREGVARALGGDETTVTELVRLYTKPSLDGTNWGTWFLSRAVRGLRPQYEIVVAFSDPNTERGQYGGIYQAASWLYLGRSQGTPYWYEDAAGQRIAKHTPWYAAKRAGLLNGETPAEGERRYAAERGWRRVDGLPKYRYAFPRTREARKLLLPRALPYPKPHMP